MPCCSRTVWPAIDGAHAVDPTLPSAAELCFHWIEENPLKQDAAASAFERAVADLTQMGFPGYVRGGACVLLVDDDGMMAHRPAHLCLCGVIS